MASRRPPRSPRAAWALARREQARDQYLLTLDKLAAYHFGRGDLTSCIRCCRQILRQDVCREDVYQRLLRCYGRLGSRAGVTLWYRRCAAALARELEIPPAEQTSRLFKQILAGLAEERDGGNEYRHQF